MTDIRCWLDQQEALDRVEKALTLAGLAGALSWVEVERLAEGLRREPRPLDGDERYADWLVACFRLAFSANQLDSLSALLRRGARPEELLVLKVHGACAEGQDLPLLDQEELQRRVRACVSLAQDGPSQWLRGYTARVMDEVSRRRGRG